MRSAGSPPACWPRPCPRCWRCSTRSSTSRASPGGRVSTPRWPRAPAPSRRPSASASPCGRIGRGPGYDWGMPALYLRARGDAAGADAQTRFRKPPRLTARGLLLDMGGLPLPPHFVGRKAGAARLRRALADPNVTAAFVRGIGGMGKSSLAAKLSWSAPASTLDGVLVIRCHEVAAAGHPRQAGPLAGGAGQGRPRRGRRAPARQPPRPRRPHAPGHRPDRRSAVFVRVR